MPEIVSLVAPHGVLIMETFLELQAELGWGPGSPAHLLREGEHFVKFRVTCPKQRFEAASDRVGRFLKALKVPAGAAPASQK